ncbi:hypothetical protein B0H63DRAFT_110620 [Podospora didyma]|uniref:Uncharacterized protein n=1 Tax=Podospora didyma TaxID=330526 RepID=A0AAE0NZ42_9PEZI|nr:hypothetical protein B0H63DRAFT_110620 [Podospora didyma]
MQKASNKETLALADPTLLSALRDGNDLAGLIAYLTAVPFTAIKDKLEQKLNSYESGVTWFTQARTLWHKVKPELELTVDDLAKNQTIPSLRKGINKLNIYREEMDRVTAQCQTAKESKTATEVGAALKTASEKLRTMHAKCVTKPVKPTEVPKTIADIGRLRSALGELMGRINIDDDLPQVNLTYNANFARMSACLKVIKPKIEELDSILTRLNPLFGCLKSIRPASTIASLQKASHTAQYENITSLGLLELLTRIICLSCTSSAGVITALKRYNLHRVKKGEPRQMYPKCLFICTGKAHLAAATTKFVVTTSRDAAHWLDPLNVLFSRNRNQVRPSLPPLTSGGGIHLVDRLSAAAKKAYLETEARVGSLLRQQQNGSQQCSPEAVAKLRTDSHTKFRNTHPDAPAVNHSSEEAAPYGGDTFRPMARCHRCMYVANYKINDPAVQAAEAAKNREMEARTIDLPEDFHLGWLCAEMYAHFYCKSVSH